MLEVINFFWAVWALWGYVFEETVHLGSCMEAVCAGLEEESRVGWGAVACEYAFPHAGYRT